MLEQYNKIQILKEYLLDIKDNYADSFKTDIFLYFNEFEDIQNIEFNFLNELNTKDKIHIWVDKLTSRIVLKFEEENEQLSDFIADYVELG